MDASVASGRVEGKMAEQVGDGFEMHAPAVKPCGQGVSQDVDALVI